MSLYLEEKNMPDGSKYPGYDPVTGKFTDGDAQNGVKASIVPATTLNLILDNMQSFIEDALGESNPSDPNQLKNAVNNKIAPIGSLYWRYPFQPLPYDLYKFGNWADVSDRAMGYGISDTEGGNIEIFISRVEAAQNNAFLDDDYILGTQIASGDYCGKYIRSVETFEGLFFRVVGGDANDFNTSKQSSAFANHVHRLTHLGDGSGPYDSILNPLGLSDSYRGGPFGGGSTEATGENENRPTNRSIEVFVRDY